MRFILADLRRRHNALWIHLTYLEPFGTPTWAVWIYADGKLDRELSRSSSKWVALWRAWRVK